MRLAGSGFGTESRQGDPGPMPYSLYSRTEAGTATGVPAAKCPDSKSAQALPRLRFLLLYVVGQIVGQAPVFVG